MSDEESAVGEGLVSSSPSTSSEDSSTPDLAQPTTWAGFLDQALTADYGIGIMCKSSEAADNVRRQLYVARANARQRGEHDYEMLSISISPFSDDTLFVYKKAQSDETPR